MLTLEIRWRHFADFLCLALLLSFAFAIAYPRWRAGMDWRDEGLLAYGAVRVAAGEIPHRDFISVQPPLSYYATAALFKICGTSLVTLREFGLAIFLLLPLLVYGVARCLTVSPILSLAAAAPLCILGLPYIYFFPFPAWQGIAASFAAVLLFIPAALSRRQWLAIPAGLLSSISLLLRHDQGVYTIISIFVLATALRFVWPDPISKTNVKRALLFWLGGMAVIGVPLFIIWWKIGALPEMFRQLVVFPFATYRKTSSLPYPKFSAATSAQNIAVLVLYYLPPFVQAIGALYLVAQSFWRKRFGFPEAVLVFLTVWSALFYLQVTVRSDQSHLLMTLPPFFLLTAFGYSILRQTIVRRRAVDLTLSVIVTALAGSFLWILRPIALPDVSRATEQLALERGGVRIEQASGVAGFVKSLQAFVPPTRSILALPYQPMFYFLCQRRNPTHWNYLWPGDQTGSDYEHFIDQAERDPPAVVLLSEQRELDTYAPAIVSYVDAHYTRTDRVGRTSIYVRREGN
ncbi:MAG TPA: hypothetical protein VGM62_13615 [Chthoniobacterales bacterium]|jgi:hypothetical protein